MTTGQGVTNLQPGMDFRKHRHRREVWQRFYEFHLRHRSHPGGVYYVLPHLAAHFGWGPEERLWFAFLNGNTQHPVTSLMLWEASGGGIDGAEKMVAWWAESYGRLAWDTDRRYHKKSLDEATAGYVSMLRGTSQEQWWGEQAAGGWEEVWRAARSIPTFGRLSAFSYAEYLRISGVDVTCTDLMLGDLAGSKSHRNGLCMVLGLDTLVDHPSNPKYSGPPMPELLNHLTERAGVLLGQAKERAEGKPWAGDVGYFTLESALCTYKSWHRPNRRYPGVYNDMLYDRLRAAEAAWPERDLGVFWQARRDWLPTYLRLEDSPYDPGCVPVKQNHYRLTGEVPVMGREPAYSVFWSDFDAGVDEGRWGRCR